ncbi:DUF1631 family protein [Hydrogenophaga sp.]|uniref:DUF1631 family protein n=1 Tax=Hydrogenophaga sp. TaxID=1904254 RepID=UPI002716AFCA|nr:DUF1631 family protein [Hydrogenophaga sp.]MDO8903503.1 DUF1631 family protein [Hydrogenophaga sp.]
MDASQTQAFDACLREALVQTREWTPRWLDKLRDTLYNREGTVAGLQEKQALVDARTTLESYRDRISSRFLEFFAESVYGSLGGEGGSTRKLNTMSFDELELMGDEQVQETVELARVQQVVKMAADEELVALDTRMSSVLGHSRVRPEANPLRTEIVIAALMRAINGLHVDPVVRARWLQMGAVGLGSELQQMYAHLSRLLDDMGVRPAGYKVVQVPDVRSPAAAPLHAETVTADSVLGSNALLTLDHLHQLLIGNLDQSGDRPSDQGVSGSGNAMVRTLAAEVVTFMLKRIHEDKRLMPSVRQVLLDMKPALLQLARSEPRFFADRQNPARRLLDTVTARSLAFTSEQDPGYETFARQVRDIQRALEKPGADLASRFPKLLEELTQSQALAPEQAQARGLAVKTLVRVEQRNMLAERVAAEFRARNDFDRVPGVVRRFLTGPWAQVVAQARMDMPDSPSADLSPASSAALRYTDILPDLLWSSQLAQASRNRPRLIKVIPGLLRTLREGLDSIDYPRDKTEAFFQTLMGLHEAAYKTLRPEIDPDAPVSLQVEEDLEPWIHPVEAKESGFMEDAFLESTTQPSFQDTQPMQHDWADIKAEMAEKNQAISVGTWVDVWHEGQPMRAQLTWASPHNTMFLFTAGSGRSLSMTRRGLDNLLANNRLRVVANHGLIDDALDEIARQAWINSSRGA